MLTFIPAKAIEVSVWHPSKPKGVIDIMHEEYCFVVGLGCKSMLSAPLTTGSSVYWAPMLIEIRKKCLGSNTGLLTKIYNNTCE